MLPCKCKKPITIREFVQIENLWLNISLAFARAHLALPEPEKFALLTRWISQGRIALLKTPSRPAQKSRRREGSAPK